MPQPDKPRPGLTPGLAFGFACTVALLAILGWFLVNARPAPHRAETESSPASSESRTPASNPDLAAVLEGDERRKSEGSDSPSGVSGKPTANAQLLADDSALGRIRVEFTGPAIPDSTSTPTGTFSITATPATGTTRDKYDAYRAEVDGSWWIDGIPEGVAWRLRLRASEFIDTAQLIPALAEGEVRVVEIELARGVSASGVVTGDDGTPIERAVVRLRSWRYGDAVKDLGREAEVRTDARGRYAVGGVTPGEMVLDTSAENWLRSKEELGLHAEGDALDVDIVLDGGGRLSGLVRWPDGTPAATAHVTVSVPGNDSSSPSQAVDENGAFYVQGLRGSTFRVVATAEKVDGSSPWIAIDTASAGDELDLVLGKGATVSGRVVDDTGAAVTEFKLEAKPVERDRGYGSLVRTMSDRDGRFSIEGLGPGVWELNLRASDHVSPLPRRVSVPSEDDVRIVMPRTATLHGVVLDRSNEPVIGARVEIGARNTKTSEGGAFALVDLAPGEQRLTVAAEGHGPAHLPMIVLDPGEVREDVVVKLTRGGRVLGQLHPDLMDGTAFKATLRPDESFDQSTTDVGPDGTFRFEGLRAGEYWAALSASNKTGWVEGNRLSLKVPVTVREDSDSRVVLGDPSDYPITLRGVVTKEGEPAPDLLMYVYGEGDESAFPGAIERTDAQGAYEVYLREPGAYHLSVGEGQMTQARYRVDVTNAPAQTFDCELPDKSLRGRATLVDGTPAGGRMFVLSHEGTSRTSIRLGEVLFARTDRDGTFKFDTLAAGRYRLRTGNYIRAHATDGLVRMEGIVVPDEGEADELEIVIPRGAVVDVTARGPSGHGRRGLTVTLDDETGHPAVLYDSRTTNYAGLMRFTGVGPGTWAIVCRDGDRVVGRGTVTTRGGEESAITIDCEL